MNNGRHVNLKYGEFKKDGEFKSEDERTGVFRNMTGV